MQVRLKGLITVSWIVGFTALAAPAQTPVGTAFTYQGHVKQSGSPMSGNVTMTFKLFDAVSAGTQQGSTLTFDGAGGNPPPVAITNGLFTVQLDFGVDPYTANQARWLEIAVSGTMLSPRQPLKSTPFSLNTRGLNVDASGRVGIGTTTPHSNFNMQLVGGPGAWQGGVASGGNTSAVVTGELSGMATIGAHNGALDDWRDLCISPYGNVGIGTTGNVGIGTTTPSQKLTVRADSTCLDARDARQVLIQGATDANQQLELGYCTYDDYGSIQSVHQNVSVTPLILQPMGGNVGIGTNTPSNRLSVAGNAGFSGDVGIGTSAPKQRLHNVGDYYGKGHVWLHAYEGDGSSGTAYLQARDDSGAASIGLTLRTQNAGAFVDAMSLTPTGSVGIGTTTPHSNFMMQLKGGSGAWKGGIAAGGNFAATVIGEVAGVATLGGHSGALDGWGDLSINPVAGNVGIGTTSPTSRLDVAGTLKATGFQLPTGAAAGKVLTSDAGGTATWQTAPSGSQWSTQGANIAYSGGNVGIGTTTPGAALDVHGDIKLGGSGQYFATAGGENLRIVRGHVDNMAVIRAGSGFSVVHNSTGSYTITFDTSFPPNPVVTVTPAGAGGARTATIPAVTPSAITFNIYLIDVFGPSLVDSHFEFIAVGPR